MLTLHKNLEIYLYHNFNYQKYVFSHEFMDFMVKWTNEIFNCSCKDNPYCDCGRINLEKLILNLRVKDDMLIRIIEETKNRALAVGKALFDASEMESKSSGKVVKNLHTIQDSIWEFEKEFK